VVKRSKRPSARDRAVVDDRADTNCKKVVSGLGVFTEFDHAYDIQRIMKGFM
jgi:hypothetical protein